MENQDTPTPDAAAAAPITPAKPKKDWVKEAKSYALIIGSILVFRSTFFEPFKIPSDSMNSTLLTGDFLLVNKFAYGFKLPLSDWFGAPIYLTGPEQPKRGDVLVFKFPKDPSFDYIKRVVGLPGDTVEMVDKVVYVNGKPMDSVEVDGKERREILDDKYKNVQFKFFKNKDGEHEYFTQIDPAAMHSVNTPKFTVPSGMYFMMGDNRDLSGDSRMWGFMPFENVKGKAILIWFSMAAPWPWQSAGEREEFHFRPGRIGKMID